jgi:hypothetical protein
MCVRSQQAQQVSVIEAKHRPREAQNVPADLLQVIVAASIQFECSPIEVKRVAVGLDSQSYLGVREISVDEGVRQLDRIRLFGRWLPAFRRRRLVRISSSL